MPFRFTTFACLTTTLLSCVCADSQYRSRPDLAPPRLNVTIPATEASPGYLFVGPYPGFDGVRAGPEQAAGYIFRDDGDLVWSSLGYLAGWVANLQVVEYQGRPAIQAFQGSLDSFHGHGYGVPMLLDQHYRPVAQVQALAHKFISIHEFKVMPGNTALVEVYQPTAMDLTPYGAKEGENWIADGVFQEIDLETGKVLFEGSTLNFASPADSVIPLRSGRAFTGANASDAWDYFHINSVDKNEAGDYLISGRHTSSVYKVSGKTGQLIWKLDGRDGGSNSSFVHDFDFGYQHDARFLNHSTDGQIETISFFDNSARSDRQRTGGVDLLHPHSRARIVQLNHTDGTAAELMTLASPDLLSTWSQGNVQVHGNGHVFVNWGQAGAVTEYNGQGIPIFNAYLDSGNLAPGVQSYRGFRYEWTGYSQEVPAIVALQSEDIVSAYVSWNGDTKVAVWRFYHSCGRGEAQVLSVGSKERNSFETELAFDLSSVQCEQDGAIFAEGVGADGSILATTDAVHIQQDVLQIVPTGLSSARDNEQYPMMDL